MRSMNESLRVERVLTDRLMTGNVALRVLALALWLVFAIIYWGIAPWWLIVGPMTVHLLAMAGFIRLSLGYRAHPESQPIETWRVKYIVSASLTGIA
jgi:hypothetical protein